MTRGASQSTTPGVGGTTPEAGGRLAASPTTPEAGAAGTGARPMTPAASRTSAAIRAGRLERCLGLGLGRRRAGRRLDGRQAGRCQVGRRRAGRRRAGRCQVGRRRADRRRAGRRRDGRQAGRRQVGRRRADRRRAGRRRADRRRDGRQAGRRRADRRRAGRRRVGSHRRTGRRRTGLRVTGPCRTGLLAAGRPRAGGRNCRRLVRGEAGPGPVPGRRTVSRRTATRLRTGGCRRRRDGRGGCLRKLRLPARGVRTPGTRASREPGRLRLPIQGAPSTRGSPLIPG
jgi:hypothetical protein